MYYIPDSPRLMGKQKPQRLVAGDGFFLETRMVVGGKRDREGQYATENSLVPALLFGAVVAKAASLSKVKKHLEV